MDIGGTKVRWGMFVPEDGWVKRSRRWPSNSGFAADLRWLVSETRAFISATRPPRAIGISLAAVLDKSGVVTVWGNRAPWVGHNFAAEFSRALQLAVHCLDDVAAAAHHELQRHGWRNAESFLYVSIGTGVGSALVLHGKVWRGANGLAGELGHFTVADRGLACACGRRGCLQLYASGRRLERLSLRQYGDPYDLFARWRAHDVSTYPIIRAATETLAKTIGKMVAYLDIATVFVGGGVPAKLGRRWLQWLREGVVRGLWPNQRACFRLRVGRNQGNAALLGALHYVTTCVV